MTEDDCDFLRYDDSLIVPYVFGAFSIFGWNECFSDDSILYLRLANKRVKPVENLTLQSVSTCSRLLCFYLLNVYLLLVVITTGLVNTYINVNKLLIQDVREAERSHTGT